MKELKLRCKNWDSYQHYKKKNKNYSVEQPWFMMYGRKLLGERKYMELKPEEHKRIFKFLDARVEIHDSKITTRLFNKTMT